MKRSQTNWTFLGITRTAILKTAGTIMDIISKFLISKEIQPYLRFCGLNRTNSVSSERRGLQHLIKILCHMLSIPIAIITWLHWGSFIYLKNFLHSYYLVLCSFLYESCLSTVLLRKKSSTICNMLMSLTH